MEDRNRERLILFEGILIGIYGNWLVSLLDRITFTKVLVVLGVALWFYQLFCVIISFTCLILMFAYRLFMTKKTLKSWDFAIFASGHLLCAFFALYIEMLNTSVSMLLHNVLFFIIGALLFFLIYICEIKLTIKFH